MCILVLCNISSLGWFAASLWGYILGRIYYWLQNHFKEQIDETPSPAEPDQRHSIKSESPQIEQPIAAKESPKNLSIFSQFSLLKHQVEPTLADEAKDKLQEIHALLTVLNRKLNNSRDIETRRAIQKIQRIINNYLTPALNHYQEIPIVFHHRILDQGKSPNQMILEQLTLVHDELMQITEHVFADDLNALIQHGLFLEQKFKPPQFFKVGRQLESRD